MKFIRKKFLLVLLSVCMSFSLFANTNRVLRIGIFEEYSQGSSGYSTDMQQVFFLSLINDPEIKVKFITASRREIISMVKNDMVDIIPFIEHDEALESTLDFSDDTIVRSWDVLLVDKSLNYNNAVDINGLRIGLLSGMPSSVDFVSYVDSLGFDIFPIYSRNFAELIRAVKNKEVDGIIVPSFAERSFLDYKLGLARTGFFFNSHSIRVATADGDPLNLMPTINQKLAELSLRDLYKIQQLFNKHKVIKKYWLENIFSSGWDNLIVIFIILFICGLVGIFYIFKKPKHNTSLSRSVLTRVVTVTFIFLIITLIIEAFGLYRVYVNEKKKLQNDVFNYSKKTLLIEAEWLKLLIETARYDVQELSLDEQKEYVAKKLNDVLTKTKFHFFIKDYNGVKITGKSIGENLIEVTDKNGVKIVQEQIDIARNGGGFLLYNMVPEFDHGDRDYYKLSYCFGMDDFQWVIGVGVNIHKGGGSLVQPGKYLDKIIINQFLLITVVLIILFIVMILIGYRLASLLKMNRLLIDKYLEEAFENDIIINEDDFYYKEFRYIVSVFNKMLISQQESKRALLEQEENLRITFASIGDAIITVDTNSVITRINIVASKLTGWGVDEAVGQDLKNVFKVINLNTRLEVRTPVERVLRTGEISALKKHTSLISKDKKEYMIDDSAAPIKDSDGKIVGVILVFRDVSEEYRMQKKINDQQKDESIGLLAGGVAHDFNNILQVILGHAELIKFKCGKDVDQDYFDTIENAGLKGRNLVQQLLQFSKKEFYTPVEVDISEAVRANEMLLSHAVPANIEFQLELADDLPNVMLDQTQFSQLLMNLVINARHALHDKNGKICVKTFKPDKYSDNYFVNPTRVENVDFVAVSVSDTGSGIPDSIVDKIFEPFFTTKEEKMGTGMGLAAVYGIVKHHGGDIRVSKSKEWATIFTVYIPVFREFTGAHNAVTIDNGNKDESTQFDRSLTILIAEDDVMVQKLTVSTLMHMGANVLAADDGKQAVDLFVSNRSKIDILVFDIVMPILNGVEAYKIIRAYKPDIPVVFVTGYSDNKMSELANEDPSLYLCLRKPCKKIELYNAIKSLLDNKNV